MVELLGGPEALKSRISRAERQGSRREAPERMELYTTALVSLGDHESSCKGTSGTWCTAFWQQTPQQSKV